MPYTPKPLKPYIPVPTKPYMPAATRPYIPAPLKPFMPKTDPKKVGAELYENEVEALRVIGEVGGAATVRKVARLLGRPPTRTHNDCEVLAEADYIDLFDPGMCRMKPRGWQELEERGHHFTGATFRHLDVSYRELHVLMAIAEAGGATTLLALRGILDIEKSELAALCHGLGQGGYADVFQSGLCSITRVGWQLLEKGGYRRSKDSPNVADEEFLVLKAIGDAGGQASLRVLASRLAMDRHEAARRCKELGGKDLIDLFNSGLCVMKRAGWEELAKGGYHRPEASQVGLTDQELQALRIIGQAQGDTTVNTVAQRLEIDRRGAAILCEPLGQRDYIDLFRSGRCIMKPGGWEALEQASPNLSQD